MAAGLWGLDGYGGRMINPIVNHRAFVTTSGAQKLSGVEQCVRLKRRSAKPMKLTVRIAVICIWLVGICYVPGAGFLSDWARMKGIVPQGDVCHHTTGPITVDGRLDESDWQRAAWTRDFVDIEDDAKSSL